MLSSFVYTILPEIQSLHTGPLPNLLYELLSSFFLTIFIIKGQSSQVQHPKLLIRYTHCEDLNTHQNYWRVSMSLENKVNFGSIIHSCNSGMY
jgi:hypothetical protein